MIRLDPEAWRLEHERKMREDPEYRAQEERSEAERRVLDEHERAGKENTQRLVVEKRRQKAGIPGFTWPVLAKPNETEALRLVRRLAADAEFLWLVLAGPPGTGKSVAAAWWIDSPATRAMWEPHVFGREGQGTWTDKPQSGLFVPAIELVRHGMWGEDAAFWTRAHDVDRLVLDDLGTEPLDEKGRALASIADLLTQRHAWQRKTLVTTNLPLEHFRRRYMAADGGRLNDRLRSAGLFYELKGKSLRPTFSLDLDGR